jgi:hypothetical protein
LIVLLLEGMVLDDNLGVGALQFRFEGFWRGSSRSMLNALDDDMLRTLGNIYIESSQSKIGLQVSRFGLLRGGAHW